MGNVNALTKHAVPDEKPGLELRWPASAIWRPGEPAIRKIGIGDLRAALGDGIGDFNAVPSHALFLCLIYPLIGIVLVRLLFGYEMLPLIYPIVAGFALIGPAAAIGLYELSRRRELGLDATVWHVFEVFRSPSIGAILRLTLVLLLIFFGWLALARVMYRQIMGSAVPVSLTDFATQVWTTDAGTRLILVGNLVGFCFALVVLVISAISFPLLVDRQVSAATAVRTSVRAFLDNPATMAMWGAFVAGSLLLASLPLFLGLAVVFPILGHATWHLYRKVVSPTDVYSDGS